MNNSKLEDSELILNPDGSVYHLHIKAEDIADTIILVGDQHRVAKVSRFFDEVDFKVQNREFITHTGKYKGNRISVLSTGIGTDNIDIVLNELDAAVNIDRETRIPKKQRRSLNLIRIGTSGSLQKDIKVNSFLISEYAIGFDGLMHFYEDAGLESDETKALEAKINEYLNWDQKRATPYLKKSDDVLFQKLSPGMTPGITASASGFYGPQGRQLMLKIKDPLMQENLLNFRDQGRRITNFEMETSALYGLGSMLGHKCCTCCVILANRYTGEFSKNSAKGIDLLIQTVLDRMF